MLEHIYLHNIFDYETSEDGILFKKFSPDASKDISPKGLGNRYTFHGAELRFIPKGKVKITVNSLNSTNIAIYYGDFQGEHYHIESETEIIIDQKFDEDATIKLLPFHRFHPQIVRVIIEGSLILKSIEGDLTKPLLSMMPNKKYLAYGTSITQGRNSILPELTYPQLIADQMGYDVVNLSMSGSCYIERSLVDDMLKTQYDCITLELSVNMLGDGFGVDEFMKRADYLLKAIKERQPNSNVFCISILDNWRHYGFDQNRGSIKDVILYKEAFKKLANQYDFYYIDGASLLKKQHLSSDLIHPSHYGIIEIASNILKHM